MSVHMNMSEFTFTLWDVGHGLSIWLGMPSGAVHWIDLGRTPDFSPSSHVRSRHHIPSVDYLVISHPDKDHLEDLPSFARNFGDTRVLHRNKTLPAAEKYGEGGLEYQQRYQDIDTRFNASVAWATDPMNPAFNGGVEYVVHSLCYGQDSLGQAIHGNDTSLVVFLRYLDTLIVCPGDIEPRGWQELWRMYQHDFDRLTRDTRIRFLVAPHHGRKSGYCKEMMDAVDPHAVIISDIWGQSETHPSYFTVPHGLSSSSGTLVKCYSTKRKGRVRIGVSTSGVSVDQYQP